eukprot:Protomagalhaensia_wolfi_Nauph_80__2221@NODE_2440_length_1091_cov_36_220532_g1912_i0_p1_GENE_NODE_2440_length_1091_cov_36_220532_g1912_i0NODE_2440_length_1091_cov_36_220532_g1912_i0_p1_ORF_typecomplete_len157_score15_48PLD_C/PF12357_8/2_1e13PLDc_2/PF13091_6/1_6e07PLDc/PF00614_22/5_5e05PLDc/PF00614_22/7_4e03_NODE_2440_length_1091_cov_36_220532_g1912_i0196666
MMIVDDEYIVIGSANINDRSMSGCRDTEIAFGACQPAHLCQPSSQPGSGGWSTPQGDIHAFRLHLWHEHLGGFEPSFADAASPACMQRVNEMAEINLKCFDGDVLQDMPYGHLCRYPYHVTQDGDCGPMPDRPNLPGFSSPVCGLRSALLPGALTT